MYFQIYYTEKSFFLRGWKFSLVWNNPFCCLGNYPPSIWFFTFIFFISFPWKLEGSFCSPCTLPTKIYCGYMKLKYPWNLRSITISHVQCEYLFLVSSPTHTIQSQRNVLVICAGCCQLGYSLSKKKA